MQLGPFHLTPIDAGAFRLDGGAMFGVVPKTLWSKTIEADEKNRIPMVMRSLLVRSEQTGRTYLIDNGCGTKFNAKMAAIYELPAPPEGPNDSVTDPLLRSLEAAGVQPADITDLIFTHLHFDHCGGTTAYSEPWNPDSPLVHVFPNAQYHVNRRHWLTATQPNAREKASFLPENIEPLKDALAEGRLQLVKDGHEFEPGFDVLNVEGHTVGQQLPRLKGMAGSGWSAIEIANQTGSVSQMAEGAHSAEKETTLVFAGDLIPLHQHLKLPWVMGYDMAPLETLREKEAFLKQASEENWVLFLEHDALKEMTRVE